MTAIGTWEWAEQTGGRLSVAERLRLLAEGIPFLFRRLSGRRLRHAGLDRDSLAGAELPERPPDSRLAREAEELCEEVSSPALLNHCLRTYIWGSLLGSRDRLRWDEELLYVAAMLHDLGLVDRYFGKDPTAHCFAVEGARAAAGFCSRAGCEPVATQSIAEAISLHLNVVVELEHGPEAHLLQRGAGFDVIGRDFRSLERATVARVLEAHPRKGLKRELDEVMREQVRTRPESRIALYYRFGGFGSMMANAPFDN